MFAVGFIIGMVVGTNLGLMIMALFKVNKR